MDNFSWFFGNHTGHGGIVRNVESWVFEHPAIEKKEKVSRYKTHLLKMANISEDVFNSRSSSFFHPCWNTSGPLTLITFWDPAPPVHRNCHQLFCTALLLFKNTRGPDEEEQTSPQISCDWEVQSYQRLVTNDLFHPTEVQGILHHVQKSVGMIKAAGQMD